MGSVGTVNCVHCTGHLVDHKFLIVCGQRPR